jgi:hypothetical protein
MFRYSTPKFIPNRSTNLIRSFSFNNNNLQQKFQFQTIFGLFFLTSPSSSSTKRFFNTAGNTSDELGPMYRMKQISPLVGQPKPCLKENDWVLRFNLRDKMPMVIRTLLSEENWADAEITREIENFMGAKYGFVTNQRDRRSDWDTVEDFQRTPWYRRWRPNESSSCPMVSLDCMKILEKNLIPPSARHDPYAHLRKRHYEDTFHNEKFSEGNIRDLTREKLAPYTKGMPGYGKHSRKEFLAFEKEYRKRQPGTSLQQHEVYNAWKASQR